MSSLQLQDMVLLTEQNPELSFDQVQQFISLASRLKDDILLTQLVFDPPDVLPPTVSTFLQLQKSCGISVDCVEACWNILKSTIWNDAHNLEDSLIRDFAAHSHSLCVTISVFAAFELLVS